MSSRAADTIPPSSYQNAAWTEEKRQKLIDFMVQHHHTSEAEGGSAKKEQWIALSRVIGEMTPDQCKNKWGDLKMKYRQWKELERQPSFRWNEETHMYEASSDDWIALGKSWRNIVWHKTHVLPYRAQLEMMLASSRLATATQPVSAVNTSTEHIALQHNQLSSQSHKRRASSIEDRHRAKSVRATTTTGATTGFTQLQERAMKMKEEERFTKSERAVRLVGALYRGRMSLDHMVDAFELLEDEATAGVLLAIEDDEQRDTWLKRKANVVLWDARPAGTDGEEAGGVPVRSEVSQDDNEDEEGVAV